MSVSVAPAPVAEAPTGPIEPAVTAAGAGAAAGASQQQPSQAELLSEMGTGRALADVQSSYIGAQAGCAKEGEAWRLVLTHAEIQMGVRYLAGELNARFRDEEIVLCAILKGAYLLLSDLTKLLTISYSVYFVEASSYGDSQTQGESVELLSRLVPSKFHDRKVVLIDELFDHGTTMKSIKDHLVDNKELRLSPEDVFTVTVFGKDTPTDKPQPDLCAITNIPQLWLVGYGLDDQGEKRGWGHLFACPKIEGVPRVPADECFRNDDEGKAAHAAMRAGLLARLREIERLGEKNSATLAVL